ncbi:MAG: PEP-CTERM sorting domain-containing protein [Planctomycetota bacterium]
MKRIVFGLAIAIMAVTQLQADVFINELRISQPSTDTDNFIELAGDPNESLAGMTLLTVSGEFEPGLIEFAYDLDSFLIPTDGFFLAHQTDVNADLVTGDDYFGSPTNFLLVRDFTGAVSDDIDTDNDGVADTTPWSSVVDGVFLFDGDANPDFAYGGSTPVGPDGNFAPAHVFRFENSTGGWNIGSFSDLGNDTPGFANVPEPGAVAFTLLTIGGLLVRRRK